MFRPVLIFLLSLALLVAGFALGRKSSPTRGKAWTGSGGVSQSSATGNRPASAKQPQPASATKKGTTARKKKPPPDKTEAEARLRHLLADPKSKQRDVSEWASNLARHDFELAISLVLGSRFASSHEVLWPMGKGAAADIEKMLTVMLRHPELQPRDKIGAWPFFEEAASKNPLFAWRAAKAPGSRWDAEAVAGVCTGWVNKDPHGALVFGQSLQDPAERTEFFNALASAWVRKDFPAAAAWLRSLPAAERNSLKIEWNNSSPNSLADVATLMALAESGKSTQMMEIAGRKLGDLLTPTLETEQWIASLATPEQKDTAALAYALKYSSEFPEKAQRMADLITGDAGKRKLNSVMAARLAKDDLGAALSYAAGLGDARSQMAARQTILDSIGNHDPAKLATLVAAPNHSLSEQELSRVGSLIADEMPQRLAELALSQPPGKVRDDWLRSAVGAWTRSDPQSASMWVSQLSSGPSRDLAIHQMSIAAARDDPPSALQWAASIGDEKLRQETNRKAFYQWINKSPSQASQWLEQQRPSLTPESLAAFEESVRISKSTRGWSSIARGSIHYYQAF